MYCFEPIPENFKALKENVSLIDSSNIYLYNFGLSSKEGIDTYYYYPDFPSMSSRYSSSTLVDIEELVRCFTYNLDDAPKITRILQIFPKPFRIKFLRYIFHKGISRKEEFLCTSRTISSIIEEKNIDKIDLLKVDAEGSEYDILMGIDKLHWPKIRQLVLEIHDLDQRLNNIKNLLQFHNFKYHIYQDPLFKDSRIYNISAFK